MSNPTYTMDEVYEEAIRFCKEKGFPITCKKENGLPKGEPGSQESCVIANLVGRDVGFAVDYYLDDSNWKYAIRAKEFPEYWDGAIIIDSRILQTFIAEFDNGKYPELIS